jgi:alcohol dehydrogenase class IV
MVQAGEMVLTRIEHVLFGQAAAAAITDLAARRDARRVLLAVSESLRRSTGEIAAIEGALGERWTATWSGMRPHAPRADVIALTAAARSADADLIVAVGGGSVVDAAKIVALALANDVATVDGLDALANNVDATGKVLRPALREPSLRVICVPTTLSGGEFGPGAGALNEETRIKQGFLQANMAPWAIVLDPALTRHTPQWLWLSTGVRSLDHAIETLASLRSHAVADGAADNAIRLLAAGLQGSKADPNDLEARLSCQMGAWQSMLPLVGGVPMGASHAISHAVGSTHGVPHGYTSCVMLPAVLAWSAGHDAGRQQRISTALGMLDAPASEALRTLLQRLELPTRLSEVGVAESDFPELARKAMGNQWIATGPRPVASPEDAMEILRLAA